MSAEHVHGVGLRELRHKTAEVLARVRHGETIDVTAYGRLIARIIPVEERLPRRSSSSWWMLDESSEPRDRASVPTCLPVTERIGLARLLARCATKNGGRGLLLGYRGRLEAARRRIALAAVRAVLRRPCRVRLGEFDPVTGRIDACGQGAAPALVPSSQELLLAFDYITIDQTIIVAAINEPDRTLRSLDAIHLATSRALGTDLTGLATYDDRLASAAMDAGMTIISPRD